MAGNHRHLNTSTSYRRSRLLWPVLLVALLYGYWQAVIPLWVVIALPLALVVARGILPRLVEHEERHYDRGVLRLLQQGRRDELLSWYRRHRFLRLFAPAGPMARRLGLVHFERGAYRLAQESYGRAAHQAEPGERVTVLLGLAQARYRSGDYSGAVRVYRELVRRGQDLPEVLAGLAHCLLLSGGDRGEAWRLARRAREGISGGTMAVHACLTLAEAWLARGTSGQARELWESLAPPEGDRWLAAHYHWVAALIAQEAGQGEEAQRSWAKVAQLDAGAGLGRRAEELAEGTSHQVEGPGASPSDPIQK